MIDMTDCFLMELQPCDRFAFSDAVENFDPNVEYIPGPAGPQGPPGPPGAPGEYSSQNPPPYPVTSVDGKTGAVTVLPTGGTTGQVLKKRSDTSRDVEWGDETGGGGSVTAEDAGSVSPPSPFILAIGEGGTGANSAASARENLGALASDAFIRVQTEANRTYTFSCSDKARFILVSTSVAAASKNLAIFNVSALGAISHSDILAGNVTYDESVANTLKFTPGNAGAVGILVFDGTVTPV